MAISVSQANTVSNHGLDDTIRQVVYARSAFFWKLKAMSKMNTGGTDLRTNIRYTKLGRSGSVSPTQQITFGQTSTRTAAVFNRAFYESDTMITWKQRSENYGKGKIIDLIKDLSSELQDDFYDALSTDLYTQATGSYALVSLASIVGSASLGAVAAADATTWKSSTYARATLSLFTGTSTLGHAVANASKGTDKPSLHVTTPDLWNKFNSLMVTNVRYSDTAMANAGFDNIKFFNAPVVADQYAKASSWYGIDMSALEFRIDPDFNFKVTPWMDLDVAGYPNSMSKVMSLAGQLVCDARWTSFKFTALDYTK